MNIFSTDICPIKSAQALPNVLVNKMVVEAAQILSVAHYKLDGDVVGYKPTHHNHPSCIWSRSSSENYLWLYAHFKALCDEFTLRTGKVHKTSELLPVLSKLPKNIPQGELQPFALVMPVEFQKLGIFDQTKAYKACLTEKFKEWACREKPIKVDWGFRGQPDWLVV